MSRRRRRRKLKRWLYFPLAAVLVVVAALLFKNFIGDGAQKRAAVASPEPEEATYEPAPTPEVQIDRLFSYYDGSKWGYKDQAGRVYETIPVIYDAVQPFSEGRAFVGATAGGVTTWSLIDGDGGIVAANLPYTEVRAFSGGYAAVKGLEGWGYINADGLEVVSPSYDYAGDCSVEILAEGAAVQGVTPGAGMGASDGAADMSIPSETQSASETGVDQALDGAGTTGETQAPAANAGSTIGSGLAVVGKHGKYGYIAPGLGDGVFAIPAIFDSANQFGDGMAFVSVDGVHQIIDVNSQPLATVPGSGSYFSDLMAPVRVSSDQYVYYDARTVLSQAFINLETGSAETFEDARNFSEGLAPVKVGGVWGFIGQDSAIPVITPMYLEAQPFSQGLAVVQDATGKWGAIDSTGTLRITCKYDELESFKDGYSLGRVLDTYYAVALDGSEAQLYIRSAESEISGSQVMVVQVDEGTVNVRSAPDVNSDRLAAVENGVQVTVLGEEGEWTQIVVGTITGYIMTRFLVSP